MKQLIDAGTTVKATPQQAQELKIGDSDLDSLLSVSETEPSSIDQKDVDVALMMDGTPVPAQSKTKKTRTEEDEEDSDSEDVVHDARLMGKFVNLIDLFPPLPKKGNFDMATIRKSQYFFS